MTTESKRSREFYDGPDGEWFDGWTDRWIEERERQPFLLCTQLTPQLAACVELFRKFLGQFDGVDVIINSIGGSMDSSFRIPYLFQRICPDYVAFVPKAAKSGATLFCLGAKEIVMGRWAELGPLDPQVSQPSDERHYFRATESALESFRALRFAQKEASEYLDGFHSLLTDRGVSARHAVREGKELVEATIGRIYTNVSPFELGASGRVLETIENYCKKIMAAADYQNRDIEDIAKKLVWSYPDHGFFIDQEDAKELKLRARTTTDREQDLLDELECRTESFSDCVGTLSPATEEEAPDAPGEAGDDHEVNGDPDSGNDAGGNGEA